MYPSPSSLPYRTSFPPSPPRGAGEHGGMTPGQCVFGLAPSPESLNGSTAMLQSSQPNNMDSDMDMDDDDEISDIRSQPPESPALHSLFSRPPMLQTSLPDPSAGRLPTPIRPTFRRSGMSGMCYTASNSAANNPPPAWNHTSRQHQQDRMPSPISEDEDNFPDTPTAFTQSQLSRLSFSHAEQMDVESPGETPGELRLPPTTPRGRKRSGALTAAPGRFAMGYRDDCEKCRLRVPGHYSHFL